MGSVALHEHTELDTKGFQAGLMLASPALRCGSDPRKLGEGSVLISLGFGPRVTSLIGGNFGRAGWRRRAYQPLKLVTAAIWGSRRWRPGLPQGTALRNAWKHRLTAVQSGIAEADVTIIITKLSHPQNDHLSGAGPFARHFANSWSV